MGTQIHSFIFITFLYFFCTFLYVGICTYTSPFSVIYVHCFSMVNPFDDEIIVYNDLPCLTFFKTPSNPLGTVESFKIGNVSVGDG